jgi:hypothetical protein
MRDFRSLFACIFVAIFFLCAGCGSDSTTGTPNPRTITVTIRNFSAHNAVHIYVGEGEPNDENLVLPKESIISMVFAPRMGHTVTVYVALDKPGSIPFYSSSVRITKASWDSREAELRWTGSEIIPVGW